MAGLDVLADGVAGGGEHRGGVPELVGSVASSHNLLRTVDATPRWRPVQRSAAGASGAGREPLSFELPDMNLTTNE
jgi:hypothetical protein